MHEYFTRIADLGYENQTKVMEKVMEEINEEYDKRCNVGQIDYYNVMPTSNTGRHFNTRKEAEKFLYEKFEEKCCNSYKCTYTLPGNSKLEALRKRFSAESEKLDDYKKAHSVTAFKADFIGCPNCKSKLSKKMLSRRSNPNECPLCCEELRSETTMKTIARYKQNISELLMEIMAEQNRIIKEGQKKSKYDKVATLMLISIDTHC